MNGRALAFFWMKDHSPAGGARMATRVAGLVLAAALVAGCLGAREPNQSDSSSPTDPPPVSTAPGLLARDCSFAYTATVLPAAYVESRLPDGFTPAPWLVPGTGVATIGFLRCVDNATGEPFQTAFAAFGVNAPSKWGKAGLDFVVLAEVQDRADVVDRYRGWNASVERGAIALTNGQNQLGRTLDADATLPGEDFEGQVTVRADPTQPGFLGTRGFYIRDGEVQAAVHSRWGPHTFEIGTIDSSVWSAGSTYFGLQGPMTAKGYYAEIAYVEIGPETPQE